MPYLIVLILSRTSRVKLKVQTGCTREHYCFTKLKVVTDWMRAFHHTRAKPR